MTTADSTSPADLSRLALEMYNRSAHGAIVRSGDSLAQARRVSRWLAAMGLIQTVLVVVVWQQINVVPNPSPLLKVAGLSTSVMAGLFWLLWLWSKDSPLPPAIAALTIYTTLWWVTAAYTWAGFARQFGDDHVIEHDPPNAATLIRWIVTFGLLRAVISGLKHRRLSNQLSAVTSNPSSAQSSSLDAEVAPFSRGTCPAFDVAAPNSPSIENTAPELNLLPAINAPKRIAGITTSIVFFFVLLYIILDIIAAWGSNLLTPVIFQKMVMVNAIIIVTWSIASWRDVYRPLTKVINPLWYVAAICLGCCTFAISHGWVLLVNSWAALPSPDVATLAQTDSWPMQLLLVAISPAIVEEIAFRGIIFTAFARSLKGWETVIVTALMFMVLHASVPSFPHLLVIGLVLGILRLKTGSWLPGVFLHFTHNFLVLLSMTH